MTRLTKFTSSTALAIAFTAFAASPAWAGTTAPCVDGAGTNSTECGTNSSTAFFVAGNNATAVGTSSKAGADNTTAVGAGAQAYTDPTSVGSLASGPEAVRQLVLAQPASATAVGSGAIANGVGTLAIGDGATAAAFSGSFYFGVPGATALGSRSSVSGVDSTAVGGGSSVSGGSSTAMGHASSVNRLRIRRIWG